MPGFIKVAAAGLSVAIAAAYFVPSKKHGNMFNALKSTIGLGSEAIPAAVKSKSFYDLRAQLPGTDKWLDFSQFKGKVVLIVNTASKCGFTPQYEGLEKLYKDYHDQGLDVVGFPSNEFMSQEPGTDDDIASFCQVNYGVSFPIAKKTEVNGGNMNEVFAWLKSQPGDNPTGGTSVKWNFTKWLVDRQGKVVGRYAPTTKPAAMEGEIKQLLAQGGVAAPADDKAKI